MRVDQVTANYILFLLSCALLVGVRLEPLSAQTAGAPGALTPQQAYDNCMRSGFSTQSECASAANEIARHLNSPEAGGPVAPEPPQPSSASSPIENLKAAAERGDGLAQFRLGGAYLQGQGVPQDNAQAAVWLERAAKAGVVQAQDLIGNLYRLGQGVRKDPAEAAKWFRQAAEGGIEDAQFYMGLAYQNGDGVARDYAQAVRWYGLSAAQGSASAMANLGLLYFKGQGVPENVVYALMWSEISLQLAGRENGALQRANITAIRRRMSGDQIKREDQMASRCMASMFTDCN